MWGCERKQIRETETVVCVCMWLLLEVFFAFYGECGGHRFQFIVAYKIWDQWEYVTWQVFYNRFGYVINLMVILFGKIYAFKYHNERWVSVNLTGKIFDDWIRDLGFNIRLH